MKYKLSEIMDLIGGGTPKTTKPEYWDGDIPWLSVKDFNNDFRFVYETEKHITELGLNNSSTKLLQAGDIIISARGTVGEIATIPFPMAFNQSCYEYGHDCPFEAYITNLGKYNEGELVGEWVKFPTTSEDLKKVFERIGIGSKDDFGNPYEEWFISDYDVYGGRLP